MFSDVVDSKKFDIALMITLLSNLANLNPQHGKTTQVADLTTIKYYRNFLAHLDDGKVTNKDFDTAWDNIAEVGFIKYQYLYFGIA